jgi:imidazolonepropionase
MIRKLFRNANIFTPSDPGTPLTGKRLGEIVQFEQGAIFCQDGLIKAVGDEHQVTASLLPGEVEVEVDCEGCCLIPGFVDPHTHLCFAETREKEFALRMEGAEYLEILRQGGGILSSVSSVRAASEQELLSVTLQHALSALELGTTTLEIKSGYGLNTETELKMLRVIDRVGRETPLDVVPTFLGAHAVPEEHAKDPDTYVNIVIEEMIPAVSDQGIARFCDIFCEQGVFSVEQSRRILKAARQAGLGIKIHADEVHDLGGAGLAAELGATSAEHLLAASDGNLKAMANKGVIGVLLAGTAYSLRKAYAPARKMIDYGVPVALATDCNPGSSYTESMPFVFGLAVMDMNLSVSEALAAATLNSAYAVSMAKQVGSLDVGKSADFLLLDGESPAILAYHAGVSPVVEVYKRAELVARN